MAYILAILWGLVQGLTEILPVSGSAHMAILERVLGQTAARTEQRFFYGLLDLALAAAVLIAYRQELAAIIRAFSQKPARAADRSVRQAGRERRRLVLLLAVGLLPLLLEILLQRWTSPLSGRLSWRSAVLSSFSRQREPAGRRTRGRCVCQTRF